MICFSLSRLHKLACSLKHTSTVHYYARFPLQIFKTQRKQPESAWILKEEDEKTEIRMIYRPIWECLYLNLAVHPLEIVPKPS